jgi:hypothetical protein
MKNTWSSRKFVAYLCGSALIAGIAPAVSDATVYSSMVWALVSIFGLYTGGNVVDKLKVGKGPTV